MRKKLVRFVAINLGLLFVALMAVVAALVYKSRTRRAGDGGRASDMPRLRQLLAGATNAVGARIVSQRCPAIDLDRRRAADGARAIIVYDIAARRIVGRFTRDREMSGCKRAHAPHRDGGAGRRRL